MDCSFDTPEEDSDLCENQDSVDSSDFISPGLVTDASPMHVDCPDHMYAKLTSQNNEQDDVPITTNSHNVNDVHSNKNNLVKIVNVQTVVDEGGAVTITSNSCSLNEAQSMKKADQNKIANVQTVIDQSEAQACRAGFHTTNCSITVLGKLCPTENRKICKDEVHNVCDKSVLKASGCQDTASEIQNSPLLAPLIICDRYVASADKYHSVSLDEKAKEVNPNMPDAQMNLVKPVDVGSSDIVSDHVQDHSGHVAEFAKQSQLDSAQESQKLNECAESIAERIVHDNEFDNIDSPRVSIETSESNHSDSTVPISEEVDSVNTLMGVNDDKEQRSYGLEEDEDDVITLSEEDFMPDLVITNVCSVRDDGAFFDDGLDKEIQGESNVGVLTGVQEGSVSPSADSSNNAVTEQPNKSDLVITDVCSMKDDDTFFDNTDKEEESNPCSQETSDPSLVSPDDDSSMTAKVRQQNKDCLSDASSAIESAESVCEISQIRNDSEDLRPFPPVTSSSMHVPQAIQPAQETIMNPKVQTVEDMDRAGALSPHTPEGTARKSDETTHYRNKNLRTKMEENQREHSTEQDMGSSSPTKEVEDGPELSESLVVKLEPDDNGYEMGPGTAHSMPDFTDTNSIPDSSSVVSSLTSLRRKRSYTETESSREAQGDKSDCPKKQMIEVTSTEEFTFSKVLPGESCKSAVMSSSQQTGQVVPSSSTDSTDRSQSLLSQAVSYTQTPVLYGTLSKPLLIPSNLTAKKGTTQSHNIATKSVFLAIPPTLAGNRPHGTQQTTSSPKGTLQNTVLQGDSFSKETVISASVKAQKKPETLSSQVLHKQGPNNKQKTMVLTAPDGSVKNVAIVIDASPQVQQKGSITSIPTSINTTKSVQLSSSFCVVTSDSSLPMSAQAIIQGQGDKQMIGVPTIESCSVLNPGPISTLMQVAQSKNMSVSSFTQTYARPVKSGLTLTSVTSGNKPVNGPLADLQTQTSYMQKPAPTIVKIIAPKHPSNPLVLTTSQTSLAVKHTLNTDHQSACNSASPATFVEIQRVRSTDKTVPSLLSENITASSKQDIRLDQVSTEAKLSASDMAVMIQGKNLVAPLEPRCRPNMSGSINSMYRCVECGMMYSTLVGYTAHVKRMSMVIRYACMVCRTALVFFNKCTFLAHLRKHSTFDASHGQVLNLKSYTMSVSSLPEELLPPTDLQYMDPLNMNRNQPISCTECQETFPDSSQLAQHFTSGSDMVLCTFEFTCKYCKMQLPTHCALKAHLRLHDENFHIFCAQPRFVCPECGLQFANQLSFYQHLYATCLHFSRCVTLYCFLCKEWFPTLETLEDHIYLTHPNNRRFQCTLCKGVYRSQMSFAHHIPQMHKSAKEKVHFKVISSCGHCCGELDLVEGRKHAMKHVEQERKNAWFGFICLFCKDFLSLSRHELLHHLNQKHAAYKFICSICEQGFVTLALLRAHVLSSHNTKNSKGGGQRGESDWKFHCCMCTTTSLNSESALPHIMWHVVKKVTEVADSTETTTLHVNKRSMEIVVPDTDGNTTTYLCPSCGHVLPNLVALQFHIMKRDHKICGKFLSCPYCQRFDFASKDLYYMHTKTCGVQCHEQFQSITGKGENQERISSSMPCQGDGGSASKGKNGSQSGKHMVQVTTGGEQTVQQAGDCSSSEKKKEKSSRSIAPGQEANEESVCVDVPRQTAQQSGDKPTSSNLLGPSVQKESEKSTLSEEMSMKCLPPSSRTIVVFTKNGKIIGHREKKTVAGSGLFKYKKGSPAQSGKTASQIILDKRALQSLPQKPATSTPFGWDMSSSSSDPPLARSSFTVTQERENKELASTPTAMDATEPDTQLQYHPCHLCGLTYASADQLSSHRSSVHRGEKTVMPCQVCQKKGKTVLLSKMNLKKHLVRRHNMAKPMADTMVLERVNEEKAVSSPEARGSASLGHKRCSSDSESSAVPTLSACPVKRLRVAEGEQQEYVCAKCSFSSASMEQFHSHITAHAVDNSVQCLECGLCFSAISSLKKHLFMVHKVKQPAAYINEHDIKLKELPVDLSSHMDTLAPLNQPELVIRRPEVFHEDFHKSPLLSQVPEKRQEKERRNSSMLECNVCYKEFENEITLKSHMRTHGMAFIRSRRAVPQQMSDEKDSVTNESAEVVSSDVQQLMS